MTSTVPALTTPALLLDADKLDRNLARMRTHLGSLGVALRLHVKTAKNVEVARRALEGQAGGITVSTLAEARYFAEHGFTDILYAVGITPAKFAEAAALIARGVDLTVLTPPGPWPPGWRITVRPCPR